MKSNQPIVGVLALQGDVSEHVRAAQSALKNLEKKGEVREVRTKEDLAGVTALIIPGGESTVLEILCKRAGIFADIRKIRNIFGTCAGAILLAKTVQNKVEGQTTLRLMNATLDRNAYGRQNDSFETSLRTEWGVVPALFIRAPKVVAIKKGARVLARHGEDVVAYEEKSKKTYYLAATFHPELTSTVFHERFLENLV